MLRCSRCFSDVSESAPACPVCAAPRMALTPDTTREPSVGQVAGAGPSEPLDRASEAPLDVPPAGASQVQGAPPAHPGPAGHGAPGYASAPPSGYSYPQGGDGLPAGYPQPGYGAPTGYPQGGYGAPGHPQPGYGAPGYPQSGYGAPTGYPQGGYAPVPHGQYGVPQTMNGFAIASLVAALVGGCGIGSILAVVFGFKARAEIARTGQSGSGLATAGIVIGFFGLAFLVLWLVLMVFGAAADPGSPYS